MVASTDIKFYVHTNNNAPQLQNAYGSMINVLDACLIDGIQIGVVNSLTASGNTVTATFGTAHNLMQYQVIKITGANQPEFNGEHRILSTPDTSSFTFELAAVPSVTTATGSISASLPPLGWEKPFSSTNEAGGGKAAYRSTNLLLPSRPFLRVVDELDPAYTATYAKYAKVGIVEDMTDIDTMLGVQAPFNIAYPDANWVGTGSGATAINGWSKWHYATSNLLVASTEVAAPTTLDRDYILVGNGDYFYIWCVSGKAIGQFGGLCYGFGDFKSYLTVDTSSTFLAANLLQIAANTSIWRGLYSGLTGVSNLRKISIYKNHLQQSASSIATTSCTCATLGMDSGRTNTIASSANLGYTPLFPINLLEENTNALRGELRGIYYLLQQLPYTHNTVFAQNDALYLAVDVVHQNQKGQVVLKIGDL